MTKARQFFQKQAKYRRIHREHHGLGPWPCYFCGEPVLPWKENQDTKTRELVHHIDGNHSNDDPANLSAAHWSCHAYFHMNSDRMQKILRNQSPIHRKEQGERLSKQNKKRWKDPTYRATQEKTLAKGRARQIQDPRFRERMSDQAKELWRDPVYREQFKLGASKRANDPMRKKRQGEIAKILWIDANFRKKLHNSVSRLSESEVIAIRARYAAGGVTYRKLATEYGVSGSTIGDLIRGSTWRHLLVDAESDR